jgi:hypothetical protein
VQCDSLTRSPDQPNYTYGTVVELTATADPGWSFASWSDDLVSTVNPETITMDGNKTITATFTVSLIPTFVDIDPNTLNPKSQSDKNALTAYIELPSRYYVGQINVSTVKLIVNGDNISAKLTPTSIGDYDKDGVPDRMVKFDREAIIAALAGKTGDINMTVTGQLNGGRQFTGTGTIEVISPKK